ncbi:M23 family metallopeptidase [Neolewinella sp.]|uniref:M23 family metallopeptidase n=1 Tax=Neolewinella sp. TaxID=2993543 RepID=UPI003B528672
MARHHTPRSYWRLLIPLLFVAVYLSGGCTKWRTGLERWVDETFGSATPREQYAWGKPFAAATMARWDTAFVRSTRDTLRVELPHEELIVPDTNVLYTANAWDFYLPPGRQLRISAGGSGPLFGELYTTEGEQLLVWDTLSPSLSYETGAPAGQNLRFVLQTAPYADSSYRLQMISVPALLFPVAGKDETAIRSFWGASRDGGQRRHEGNDIFADRGTPLLAVAEGRVSRVRNGGLGGKTVWLRDGERGLNYYYAHLDSQLVRAGEHVERGDTVGLVGNTGNARTTPPHLHFGIYANGARDPYPYLQGEDPAPTPPAEFPGRRTEVPLRGNHYLRIAPQREAANVIRQLEGGEPLIDLGVTGRYHRVRTGRGELGYANFD